MLNHQPKKRGGGTGGGIVPFRESKLTHMFMNHLTGPAASRTSLIVNVNPAADDYDETQHVLGYAVTARSVTVSAVDYNRKRRMFAREGKVKIATTSPKKALANIVKKISPKKRKGGGVGSSNPQAKRLRSNSHASVNNGKKFASAGSGGGARKPPPAQVGNAVLEQLREENFGLKVTVDDLRQQLADCEAEVRKEVVEAMDEQLQESKTWYETRIIHLKQQIASLQSSKETQLDVQNGLHVKEAELLERIDECEEEMKRMREDHSSEVEVLTATHLRLENDHQAAIESLEERHKGDIRAERRENKRLEDENGSLRHRNRELQAGHDGLLARYNALAAQHGASEAASHHPSKPPESPAASYRKLPRERASDVASTDAAIDVVSPKKKRGGWFAKSPAKAKMSPVRSPLGKVNKK